ncbi:diguanylate cyclase [Bacteroidota bacterium]
MSIITSANIAQLITIAVSIILGILILRRRKTRERMVFILFLAVFIFESFAHFMANTAFREPAALWEQTVPILTLATVITYTYFIAVLTRNQKFIPVIAWSGAALISMVTVITVLSNISGEFTLWSRNIIWQEYGIWHHLVMVSGFIFLGQALYLLWTRQRITSHPEESNRIAYLFVGVSIILIFRILSELVSAQDFAIDHIGFLINSVILAYAVTRYRLIDIKLLFRKSIITAGICLFLFDSFLILLYSMDSFLGAQWTEGQRMVAIFAVALVLTLLFNTLRTNLEKYTDRLFYGKRYNYRQMVLNFANRMSHIIEMPELAETMLQPLAKALGASQVSLLLMTDAYYQTYFAERNNQKQPVVSISLHKDGPIVKWLDQNDKPLYVNNIMSRPEFRSLSQEEKNLLEAAQINLLCPIKSKFQLVAILALSHKQTSGVYLQDDIDLLMTMASEAAIVIENAQLFEKAKERANTDELTGLYNHRYFHQRLDEEIARCSRFGDIFSLILMDIDKFKKYNDIYGHLAGDRVLAHIGKLINRSLRNVDISFRYGGDEFAILLPATPIEGAQKLVERLRRGLQTATDLQGAPMTCSIGIGSWPTDGVMREGILQAIDAALYYAKQTGRNLACLACEVSVSDILSSEPKTGEQGKESILNTIYALAATVDAKDSYTYGHSKKVSMYATYIAEALGHCAEDIERIRTAALLHDIGKIGIADEVLNKQGYLTIDDLEPIRSHPNMGIAIIKHVDSLKSCLPGVQYHHEKYDGTGYPAGLKGGNIPLDARILAIADAFDAMTSKRPYRQIQATPEEAIAELTKYAGTQFDPEIVQAFIVVLQDKGEVTKSIAIEYEGVK